jgi:hypothetical protein
MQLAGAAIWGVGLYSLTLVAVISYREMSWNAASVRGWVNWSFWISAALAILAPGVVIKFRAMSLLRAGIRQERWQEKELDALRRRVNRPVWTAVFFLMFGLVLVCWLLLSLHPALSSVWLFVWMPWSLIFELRSALRKPDSLSYKMMDGNTAKPPISEHWGGALER